jgi:UPF0755 protein
MLRLKFVLLAVVAVIVAAGAGAYVMVARVDQPYKGFSQDEVFVDIPNGAPPSTIGRLLISGGVVRDEFTFQVALWRSGRARELKAGEYRFTQPSTPLEIIDRLARGDVHRRLITFREGLTIAEMAQVYETAGLGTAREFEKAASDSARIHELDPDARDLEGYLFPETYAVPRDISAEALTAQMVAMFGKAFNQEMRQAIAARGLTVRQAVTVASLVEKETAVPEERPLVAAVYLNRKRLQMPMQADPSVIYALRRAGRYEGNLTREGLRFDSPYNTYLYAGLPPGPIAAPGKAALEAVAHPADVAFLYFVSRNNGSHVFANTLEEHNRNVQRWQVEFFRQPRQRAQ